MGGKTLTSLVGSYNNLAEPIPAINNPELILGVLIPLQVCQAPRFVPLVHMTAFIGP